MLDSPTDLLRCPTAGCCGRLTLEDAPSGGRLDLRHGLLGCRRCRARYPYLMGIPIIVADIAGYLREHRSTILATLAESGEADELALQVVDSLVKPIDSSCPQTPSSPWSREEVTEEWPLPPPTAAFAGHAFQGFLSEAEQHRPERVLSTFLAQHRKRRPGLVIDVGCGAGLVARAMRAISADVLVADHTFSAVCTARKTLLAAGYPDAPGLVCDPTRLPLRPRCADAIVASRLPNDIALRKSFLNCARTVVRKRGILLLGATVPDLKHKNGTLRELVNGSGFALKRRHTIPSVRAHSERHYEVHFTEVIAARPC